MKIMKIKLITLILIRIIMLGAHSDADYIRSITERVFVSHRKNVTWTSQQ